MLLTEKIVPVEIWRLLFLSCRCLLDLTGYISQTGKFQIQDHTANSLEVLHHATFGQNYAIFLLIFQDK